MVSGRVTRLENLQVGGGGEDEGEGVLGDHVVLRGNRGGGISRRQRCIKGDYKNRLPNNYQQGGRGGVGASDVLILTQPKSSNCSNRLPLSLRRYITSELIKPG